MSVTISLSSMHAKHALQLDELQRLVFPTLAEEERLHAEQYLRHLEVFPEGQFVLEAGELEMGQAGWRETKKVMGMTTTMRVHPDLTHPIHTFADVFGQGLLEKHQPDGDWLYGLDIGIHPAYRGRGYSRWLYRARQDLVRRLGLEGQLTVGMMNGYGAVAGRLSGEEYYLQWLQGLRTDPTLTPQRRIGFQPLALIPGYVHDAVCGGYGVLLRMDREQEV
ncbi:MAG TPA: GNAT family N-acetyltransferase [Puia sp.]|nr:GNAT family N-acetyltransferase [Puia sp.]